MNMTTFIARMIMETADRGIEKGQAKYRAYFVMTPLYRRWKTDVDSILMADGYADCIVTQ